MRAWFISWLSWKNDIHKRQDLNIVYPFDNYRYLWKSYKFKIIINNLIRLNFDFIIVTSLRCVYANNYYIEQ